MIEVKLENANEIQLALGKMIRMISDKEKESLLKKIGMRIINEAVYKHFEEKTDPDGRSWPSVTAKYAERKSKGIKIGEKKRGSRNPGDLLVLTRHLYDSMHYEVNSNIVRIIAGDDTISKKYAAAHNFGLGKLSGRARKFLGIGELEQKIADDTISKFLYGQLGKV
ncbi:phage virion morphogenesis protein [Thermospira aquatica]|uniref:Phage virion morphogenesis protein n=1 Tax=Thermospira aquatica TaxID=2828656 RepID=A0AAX3BEA2_9SPIR|nr:phage virion morphogenesis protein [Thermospira aquatica]URA10541.1 phage virion morphogenesis protein [Thermospira aquatica]